MKLVGGGHTALSIQLNMFEVIDPQMVYHHQKCLPTADIGEPPKPICDPPEPLCTSFASDRYHCQINVKGA